MGPVDNNEWPRDSDDYSSTTETPRNNPSLATVPRTLPSSDRGRRECLLRTQEPLEVSSVALPPERHDSAVRGVLHRTGPNAPPGDRLFHSQGQSPHRLSPLLPESPLRGRDGVADSPEDHQHFV